MNEPPPAYSLYGPGVDDSIPLQIQVGFVRPGLDLAALNRSQHSAASKDDRLVTAPVVRVPGSRILWFGDALPTGKGIAGVHLAPPTTPDPAP